jgi:hypothetical protein
LQGRAQDFMCFIACVHVSCFICISLDLALWDYGWYVWRLCALSYYVKTTWLVISLFLGI